MTNLPAPRKAAVASPQHSATSPKAPGTPEASPPTDATRGLGLVAVLFALSAAFVIAYALFGPDLDTALVAF